MVTPWIKVRWAKKNRTTIGKVTTALTATAKATGIAIIEVYEVP